MMTSKRRTIGLERSPLKVREDENNPARGVQRRCPCNHYHDYGAGIEGAACGWARRVETTVASALELCTKFHLPRHLLEQSSSFVPSHGAGQRRHSLGKPASPVLVVAVFFHHRLDGRERASCHSDRRIWFRSTDGSYRLLYSRARYHC